MRSEGWAEVGERGVVEVEGSGVVGRDDDSTGSGEGEWGKHWDDQTGKILKNRKIQTHENERDEEILTIRPVSARGRRVTVLPSTSRFVPIEPSTNSLGKVEVSI